MEEGQAGEEEEQDCLKSTTSVSTHEGYRGPDKDFEYPILLGMSLKRNVNCKSAIEIKKACMKAGRAKRASRAKHHEQGSGSRGTYGHVEAVPRLICSIGVQAPHIAEGTKEMNRSCLVFPRTNSHSSATVSSQKAESRQLSLRLLYIYNPRSTTAVVSQSQRDLQQDGISIDTISRSLISKSLVGEPLTRLTNLPVNHVAESLSHSKRDYVVSKGSRAHLSYCRHPSGKLPKPR
ncbi:hypothetical protein P7K49_025203 [Saguinus oedipus]|uniref:Uncharacterized protein n=1 Tax=Saguinus oedipus TaxID=9490 RepID=A0ABQ9UGF4_SAGOE|nr:hypothetical protein P7K49_025203 [Saguinus oedipus]